MVVNRYATLLFFAAFSIIVLVITSKRLGDWAWDNGYYHPAGQFGAQVVASAIPTNSAAPSNASHDFPQDIFNEAPSPSHVPGSNNDKPTQPGRDPGCDFFPDTTGIQLVMKTGATEAFDKVPTQLMTLLKCLPDFLIFSDMSQDIVGHHIHDSLDTVSPEIKKDNPEFDLYNRQKACAVDQDSCNKIFSSTADDGWNLDKYKNTHMAEKVYSMRPNMDWYVFVDADTYVLWPNLVKWLHQMKATKRRYLGSATLINDFAFGHGGSGYILSGAAMAEFGKHPGIAVKYDGRAKQECCGDYVFAVALKENTGIEVETMWPTINGEKPFTLPYGPTGWCHPITTMHHMNSEEISGFYDFEQRRYAEARETGFALQPLVIKEIFHEFVEPKLRPKREDWDNDSNDWYYLDRSARKDWETWRLHSVVGDDQKNELEKSAHLSFENCKLACENHDQCFQFTFKEDCCSMKKSFLLGAPVKKAKTESKRSMSGWNVGKIQKWVKDQGECDMVKWPGV